MEEPKTTQSPYLIIFSKVYEEVKKLDYIPTNADKKITLEFIGDENILKYAFRLYLEDDQIDEPRIEKEGYTFTLFAFYSNKYMELARNRINYANEKAINPNLVIICQNPLCDGYGNLIKKVVDKTRKNEIFPFGIEHTYYLGDCFCKQKRNRTHKIY